MTTRANAKAPTSQPTHDEPAGALITTSTPATADDVAVAAPLPAATRSRAKPIALVRLTLLADPEVRARLAADAALLENYGVDAQATLHNIEQATHLAGVYARLQNSADRVYAVLSALLDDTQRDETRLARAAKHVTPGTKLANDFGGFAAQHDQALGVRRGLATKKRHAKTPPGEPPVTPAAPTTPPAATGA